MAKLVRQESDFKLEDPTIELLSDLPLRLNEEDGDIDVECFGLKQKLHPVYDAVRNGRMKTPFSVMITGGWGMGKTSSMRWLERQFKLWNQETKGKGKVRVDTAWFYPWKYQDRDDVWRGLIASVILASIDFENVDSQKVIKAAKQFGKFLGKGFLRALSSFKLNAKLCVPGTTEVGGQLDLKELAGIVDDWSETITPQKAYFNDFEQAFESWVKACYSNKHRLCIFIDDLDRCMPDIALQVLEALKLYLNTENLVFVVGVDKEVIEKIVVKKYEGMVGEEEMKQGFQIKAKQYLDKMFQVEANIEPDQKSITNFINQKLEENGVWRDLRSQVEKSADPALSRDFANLEKSLRNEAKLNPRSVVRMINVGIMGAHTLVNPRELIRSMRNSFLNSICARLTIDEHRHENPYLQDDCERFLMNWSQVICKMIEEGEESPRAILSKEVIDLSKQSALKDESEDPPDRQQDASTSRIKKEMSDSTLLIQVAQSHPQYADLMCHLSIGILMRIPYRDELTKLQPEKDELTVEAALDIIREVLSQRNGIAPEDVTAEWVQSREKLELSYSVVSDEWIHALVTILQGHSLLQALYLRATAITDSGVEHLKALQSLFFLDLSGTQITDKGVKHLQTFKSLIRLTMSNTRISNQAKISLKRALPRCQFYC